MQLKRTGRCYSHRNGILPRVRWIHPWTYIRVCLRSLSFPKNSTPGHTLISLMRYRIFTGSRPVSLQQTGQSGYTTEWVLLEALHCSQCVPKCHCMYETGFINKLRLRSRCANPRQADEQQKEFHSCCGLGLWRAACRIHCPVTRYQDSCP